MISDGAQVQSLCESFPVRTAGTLLLDHIGYLRLPIVKAQIGEVRASESPNIRVKYKIILPVGCDVDHITHTTEIGDRGFIAAARRKDNRPCQNCSHDCAAPWCDCGL